MAEMTALQALTNLSDISEHLTLRNHDEIETHNKLVAVMDYLTLPTAEEVAKAIQKYYGGSVVFKSGEFVLIGYEKPYTLAKLAGGEVKFHSRYSLPPHLIELIGRFYGNNK